MTLLIKTSALNLMVFISRHLSYYFKKYHICTKIHQNKLLLFEKNALSNKNPYH